MSDFFVHLRVHSDFSMGRGTSKVGALVKRAKELGHPAMALTDEENLHGALAFSKYAAEAGLQPIIGTIVFFPVAAKSQSRGSVILLAQSEVGYANICRLVNMDLSPIDREAGRARSGVVDGAQMKEIVASLSSDANLVKDVIAIAGVGADGLLGKVVEEVGVEGAEAVASFLSRLFPARFYVEVCRNGFPTEATTALEKTVLDIAVKLDLPIVATTDVWYASEDRHDAYAICDAVRRNLKATPLTGDESGIQHRSPLRFHMRTTQEMWDLFHDLPEGFHNACEIARRCAFKAGGRKPVLPPFKTDGGRSEAEELAIQSREGLEARLAAMGGVSDEKRKEYFDRLEFEVKVIDKMGFPGYFLIVSDFIKWAKAQGIPVGPGRGSGAGSVVAWALTITDLDPLRFGLLFERFLNPDRVSMPDFDIDFCKDRREEVIDYVEKKYGRERVARIVTFTEMKAKSAIKDVARVLIHAEKGGLSQMEINGLSGLVPGLVNGKELTLKEVYEQVADFRERVDGNERYELIYRTGLKVEGLYRQGSAHAAGVIIAGDVLTKLVPVGFDPKTGFPMTQFGMKDAETAGLVKFDFLGLETLSIMRLAVEYVEKYEGVKLDLAALSFDDKPTLDLFKTGKTTAVFQFESEGMKRALVDVGADRIEDLIAVNALFRPGPMAFIPDYAKVKRGENPPDYPDPRTIPVLEETFGIMVYQEQVMQVARIVAGYSLGEADLLRRAMGKKIKAEMDAQRARFVDGAVKGGLTENKANDIFDLLAKFADYGFNKSHAAAYAVVAYHCAYLKAHYPASFYAAYMTYKSEAEHMTLTRKDMVERKIPLLPPDINASSLAFVPEMQNGQLAVRFGLKSVKSLTGANVDPMVADRVANGPFTSVEEFYGRVGKYFKSNQFEKLSECGALDALFRDVGNRRRAFETLSFLSKNERKDQSSGDLFGGESEITLPESVRTAAEWDNKEERELNSVGFHFREHPLEKHEARLIRLGIRRRQAIIQWLNQTGRGEVADRKLYGMVDYSEIVPGANGRSGYVKMRLAEKNDSYRLSIFPRRLTAEKIHAMLQGQMKAGRPIVLIADFSRGQRDANDFFVRGTQVMTVEEYLDKHDEPTSYDIIINPRRGRMAFDDMQALTALDMKVRKGELMPADALTSAFDIMHTYIKANIEIIKAKLAESAQIVPPEKADIVNIKFRIGVEGDMKEIIMPPGVIEQKYQITSAAEGMVCTIEGVMSCQLSAA